MQIADLHLHSSYSRATSKDMTIHELARYAKIKGMHILGTGDFTHPRWLEDLKILLKNSDDGSGVYSYEGIKFVLTGEISLIYTQDKKTRKVHNVLLAPNFEVVDQINEFLRRKGRLDYDGRPIFGFSCIELVDALMRISEDIMIIPAHCLLPDQQVHCNPSIRKITDIKEGDVVLTHKNRWRKVSKTYKRKYKGNILHIKPFYFRLGTKVTPEHPFYTIKTYKNCSWVKGFCKKDCSQKNNCKRKFFEKYKPQWVQAKDLENSDVLLYPRFIETRDVGKINIGNFLDKESFVIKDGLIAPKGSKIKYVKNEIGVDKNFCRLIGYYLAEGYTVGKENSIRFCFRGDEKNLIEDVVSLIGIVFGINRVKYRKRHGSVEIIFFSKILVDFFNNFCYGKGEKKAHNKQMPFWMLETSKEKQAEILRGWWRGDSGYTVSNILMNQMKIICLRLGIIPSILIDKSEFHERRGKHEIGTRTVKSKHDTYCFSNLSFFEDKFGLLEDGHFSRFNTKMNRRHGWIDEHYIYIPIRNIEIEEYDGYVYNLEVKDDNSYAAEFSLIHNCWTPWFSIFGSMSGFDSVEECFQDRTKYIHALETGMSSDPAMNWRISSLDKFTLVSFSDSHSPYTWRIGREACVFDLKEITYKNMINAIKKREDFLYTIEVQPEYGKYHYDGHRFCGVNLSPQEAKKLNNICPKCKKPLTIGVLHRVEELADRPSGFMPKGAVPFKSLIPLMEIIAAVEKTGMVTKKVNDIYNVLINRFGSEFNVLLNAELNEMKKLVKEKLALAIIKNREGKIKIEPGYDGVYGKPNFEDDEKPAKKERGLGSFV